MELTVVVHHERESFWSEISELPGCFASGGTLEELREALGEASACTCGTSRPRRRTGGSSWASKGST